MKWTQSVLLEFFNQGDLEKQAGIPVSMLMGPPLISMCYAY